MDRNKLDILSGTFTNLHITNKKSDIASIVDEMDKEEMNSIKLITSSPRDEYLKIRLRKKLKNNKKSITHEENLLEKKQSFPLIKSRNKSKKLLQKLLLSENNKSNNNIIKKKIKKPLPHYLLDKRFLKIEECLSEKKDKKNNYTIDINDNKEKININSINKKNKISNLLNFKKNNRLKTLDINAINIKSKKINNFITQSYNKINMSTDKYYQTAKIFSEQKFFFNKKLSNNKRKSGILSKTNTFNLVKSIPRLKISEARLSDIENKLNTVYETNKNDLIEKDKEIKEFKKKYQTILDKNEQLFNYDIVRITKEINKHLLSLKFKDFYSYLLTILKNYDKRIVDWKFTVEKEKNECPSELRLKNVKKKHKHFMEKLNKQYDWGMKVNKFMDELLLNSKKKNMVFIDDKNKNNLREFINKKINKDILVDKIFENNDIYQNNNNNVDIIKSKNE